MHTAIKVENHTYLVRDSGPWPAEKRKSGCYCSQPKLNIRLLWVVGNLDCTKPRWNIRLVWVVGNLDCTKSQWNIRLVLVVGNFDCTKPRWNTQARAHVSPHSITWFDSISSEFTFTALPQPHLVKLREGHYNKSLFSLCATDCSTTYRTFIGQSTKGAYPRFRRSKQR